MGKKIYYIADLHFGHKNVIRFDDRPFEDVETMNEALIRNWNERVTGNDTVYVLGDVFWKGADSDNIIRRLKGHKHLIQGNHDRPDEIIRLRWESISGYAEINDGGRLVVISHYPILLYKNQRRGAIMLYGHVHGNKEWVLTEKWKKELWDMRVPCRAINVGCIEIQLIFILYLNMACFIDAMVVINIIINCL